MATLRQTRGIRVLWGLPLAEGIDSSDLSAAIMDAVQRKLRTSVVVRIESFDPQSMTADVTPMVVEDRLIDGELVPVPQLTIPNCPVALPYGGNHPFTSGLRRGDLVIGLYRHRSHDELDGGSNGPLSPQSTRRVSESDIIVLGGYIVPVKGLDPSQYRTDGQPVLSLPGTDAFHVGASTATYYLVRSDELAQFMGQAVPPTGLIGWAVSHTHPVAGPNTGIPNPTPPVPAYPLNSCRSDAIKVNK